MIDQLAIAQSSTGKPFTLPADAVTQTFAAIGIRGSGKTCSVMVIAEEMCRARLPWITFDPVGVWWGIRSNRDASPGGFPVAVIGGERGDIPLEKNGGARTAEALLNENISAVLDLSRESKATWRHFLTEFCLAMMRFNPELPRHLFIEEAPEFAPQRASYQATQQSKEAIERLVRLGRNNGYGATLITQRPARVDKDILSQCENLIVLRTTGPHDRKALLEWVESQAPDSKVERFVSELAGLKSGHAWFWSPHWLNKFERIHFRERLTFHPGATRVAGVVPKAASMADVGEVIGRLRQKLTARTVAVGAPPQAKRPQPANPITPMIDQELAQRADIAFGGVHRLDGELEETQRRLDAALARINEAERRADEAERRLAKVREHLRPQFEALSYVFSVAGQDAGGVNASIYEPWLEKAGQKGCRRMLEQLIKRPQITRQQLGTLAGISYKSSTFRGYMSWLRSNGLVETQGDAIKLLPV